MSVEVRPVEPDELEAYLRVVPAFAGRPYWEPFPSAWWGEEGIAPASAGCPPRRATDRRTDLLLELERSQGAFVDGKLVGTSAALALELTVPGPRAVPVGGITSVGVLPTHRRRGLLRGMMQALLEDCRTRGEPLAALGCSEGGIYGRYGFGPASFQARWTLERRQSARRVPREPTGQLELVGHETARAAWLGLHDRVRHERVGYVSAAPGTGSAAADAQHVVSRDECGVVVGAASYRVPWSPDPAHAGTVVVDRFEATTPDAYTELWRFLADQDLTVRLSAARRPVDEHLRWQLADPRALRISRVSDDLWVRLLDVSAGLAARRYATEGTLRIAVRDTLFAANDRTWHLDAGPGHAGCTPTDADPELTLDVDTLGSLFLGGVAARTLARAGAIVEHVPGAIGRASAMFAAEDAPFTPVGF